MSFDVAYLVAIAAALAAGFVRGFTGFGAALIFVPVVAAAFSPKLAAPVLLVLDFVLTLPLLVKAVRLVRWRTVLPAALAAMVTAPIGAYMLTTGDPVTLRWVITAIVAALLVLLVSGWRYHGEPHPIPSIAVGASAGVLGGIAQASGPPVIAYWISGPYSMAVVRANMICFFATISLSSFTAYFWNGLFSWEVGELVLILAPAYAVAVFVGARMFQRSGAVAYRGLAYGVIALAAILSMPVFDGVFD
ncbi:sulfite exporter TauE/SafE family protein [Bauldia sp.]|uniref:sulfite exporter TauE/SafE family protein n=1 Tax=Bauldia sp. TaxID=2575872 RepID=UPI003BA9231A